ncbi:MAG: hypothetical protein SGILL_002669 [Bacillariaceae sp.]
MAPNSKFAGLAQKAVAKEKENNMEAATNKVVAQSKENGTNNAAAKFKAAAAKTQQQTPPSNGSKTSNGSPSKTPLAVPPTVSTRKKKANANWDMAAGAATAATAVAKIQRAAAGQRLFTRKVVSAVSLEFFSPPPRNSVKGKVVPRVLNRYKHRRRLSLEIHQVTPHMEGDDGGKTHSYEECVARVMGPATRELSRKFKREAFLKMHNHQGSVEEYSDIDKIIKENGFDDDETVTDESVSAEEAKELQDHGGKEYQGWKPKYSFPISALTIRMQNKRNVSMLVAFQNVKQERDVIFDTIEDATFFVKEIEKQKRLEAKRQEGRLKAALGDITLPKFEKITLLFEIVSGYDLPIGDYTSSDPFVTALLGHQEVHRTKHIEKTLNPVWTLKTGSLFLLTVESERFFIEDGIKFLVKDFDQLGKDEVLGLVHVNPRALYKANGERMEFKLQPPLGTRKEVPGYLVIRCRHATDYDQKFMADHAKSKGGKGVASYEHPQANTGLVKTLTTRNKKKDKEGTERYRIRPGPDPKRKEQTEWMTDADLQEEVLKPSMHWTDIGNGELGMVYVEILGCDGLPNMDTGGFLGNKTDAFVSMVYEDSTCRTDTIDDCLSPRFLPWSNRAFIFHMSHPSSQLFLGVLDYDAGMLDDHDLIGRVSVDLTNLRKDTEYVLSYNICPSARVGGREIVGKITIRLRMEIPDERKVALAALEPPPPVYVNVKKRRDFRVIRETCLGMYDEEKYSTSTLKSYVEELQELQYILFYLEDALTTLLLWRGHFELSVFGKELKLPIHSLNMFIVSIFLVEHPQLVPSFCFASIAWLLIAVMGWRRNSENVWTRCLSYAEIARKLVLGDDMAAPHNIKPFENFDSARKEMEDWVKRIENAEKKATRATFEAQKEEEERLKELEEIGDADEDIGTKVGGGGISIDPVRAALYPIQLILGVVCRGIRFVKNVVIWEEAYFSFWISTGSLLLAVVCLFVPWFWLIQWTSRIIVWTLFGPWMKLVDVFYVSKILPETEEQQKVREQAEKMKRKLATTEAANKARQTRENTTKMKVMKKYMFGKFAMRIPILKQDRYADTPLPESSATPYKEKEFTLAELAMQEAGYNRTRVPGQTLVGDMIPIIGGETFTDAPIGKATAHPEKLAKSAPGASGKKSTDSTVTAYAKIGAAVAVAVAISYVGTPMITSFLS